MVAKKQSLLHIAVIGASLAGLACTRTLNQSGHYISIYKAIAQPGERTASISSPFGSFDAGAQYFAVYDEHFELALQTTSVNTIHRWSANAVRILDEHSRVIEAPPLVPGAH